MSMKNLCTILFGCALASSALGQDMTPFNEFNMERDRISKNSMLVLGGWSIANMVAGGIGMATTPGKSEANYFHQMNLAWNVVNLGIAVTAYFGARKRMRLPYNLDIPNTFEAQRKVGAIYLINFGLDFLYAGGGLWMWEHGRSNSLDKNSEMLQGYGTSLILQGGFLLVYDLANYMVHARHWKKKRAGMWDQLQFNGTTIKYTF